MTSEETYKKFIFYQIKLRLHYDILFRSIRNIYTKCIQGSLKAEI